MHLLLLEICCDEEDEEEEERGEEAKEEKEEGKLKEEGEKEERESDFIILLWRLVFAHLTCVMISLLIHRSNGRSARLMLTWDGSGMAWLMVHVAFNSDPGVNLCTVARFEWKLMLLGGSAVAVIEALVDKFNFEGKNMKLSEEFNI